ncbi:hypothetical protein AWM70_17205 [Paenibacillus yonginensis]|uniref:Uncharacterized protein n=1 Tax=Paenibacillus yonginensis TaxID=1462996 RepID=A0A1B1N3V4_9BACL|nr:hypothetical protein [Paenibacillus yonginensis]ANS76104.1 hypothetical protein AWM70_17205 [Paenibacillus yonginensis]
MITLALWIVAGYALAALAVHGLYRRSLNREAAGERRFVHYVLVTRNHGRQLEWYLRAISWYAKLSSKPHLVTLVDEHSEDDTLAIAERMSRSEGMELQVIRFSGELSREDLAQHSPELEQDGFLFVDLRKPGEAAKIPYVHVV